MFSNQQIANDYLNYSKINKMRYKRTYVIIVFTSYVCKINVLSRSIRGSCHEIDPKVKLKSLDLL